MSELALRLFGPFQVALDDAPLTGFESNKARALLAYLGAEGEQPHQRTHLAALLWPEMSESDALRNLRHALANLRRMFGDAQAATPILLVTRYTIQINPAAGVRVDVAEFQQHLAAAAAGETPIEHRRAAVDLYRDEFLQGLRVRNSAPWDEWLLLTREALSQHMAEALRTLVWDLEHGEDYAQALIYARRWVQHAPWNEEAHRHLIRLLALDGQRSAALAQFELCCQTLSSELNLAPAPETLALISAIRNEQYPLPTISPSPSTEIRASSPASPPSRFVARESELTRLDHLLKAMMAGQTQMAFITGETGSGKSALAAAFGRQALKSCRELVVVRSECSAFTGQGDPFLPFRDMLLALIGQSEAAYWGRDLGDAYIHHLQPVIPTAIAILAQHGLGLVEALALGEMLAVQAEAFLPEGATKQALLRDIQRSNRRAANADSVAVQPQRFDEYAQVLRRLSRRYPLLLIVDDMQWADAGSLALFFHLGRRLQKARIFLLGVFRSEEVLARTTRHEGKGKPHPLAAIVREGQRRQGDILIDLDQTSGRAFVDAYLDAELNDLDEVFRRALYRRTGGHALFTVELLRALQAKEQLYQDERGRWQSASDLSWEQAPARVEAIIAERIAGLNARERLLLSMASVIGDVFAVEVLAQALAWPLSDALHLLENLSRPPHHLVQFWGRVWVGEQALSMHRFRHILFQDYLHQHTTQTQRVIWHEKIGHILETMYGERSEEIALTLARHFEAAHRPMKAVTYYLQAGRRAMRLAAPDEALALYTRGLALLQQASESPEKREQEIALQMAISAPLLAMQGWGASERGRVIRRAYELSQRIGNEQALMQALFLEADMLRARGEHARSMQLGGQLLALAQEENSAAGLALAHWTLGETHFFCGNVEPAREHLSQAIAFYRASEDYPLTPLTAVDMAVVCHVWLAWLEHLAGRPSAGKERLQAALTLARDIEHDLSLAFALTLGAYGYHWLAGQPAEAETYAAELAPLMADESLAALHPWGMVFQGWARAELGDLDEGVAMMEAGVSMWRAMGAMSGLTCQLIPLARAYIRARRPDRARSVVNEALALVEQTGERLFEAEWRRLARRLGA